MTEKKIQLTDSAALRRRAEKIQRGNASERGFPRTDDEIRRLIYELQVHQIELEMQNAELRQVRDEAETALEKYNNHYDFAPIGYVSLDLSGTIQSINIHGAALMGIERSRLIGRDFGLLVTDNARPVFTDFLKKVFSNSAKEVCEVELLKEGNFQLFVQIVAVVSASGRDCRIAMLDITDRKAAEKALHDSEERHQLATTVAKEAIWEVDFGTGTTWWNRAYAEIFSRPPDEHHHGKWWLHQIHQDDRERVNDSFSRAMNEGPDNWSDTYRMKRADGCYAFIRDRAIIVRDVAGKPLRAVGAKLDVSEQVEAEEALRESEDRLHFALETCQTGAWDLNLADHNIFRSFEHDRIFGYMELLPEWTYEIFLEHVLPEDRMMVEDKFQRAIEKQEDLSFECRIRRTDGQARWIWAAGRHRQFAVEAQRRMVGIVQDITERKQAEDEILKLNTNLEKRVAERTTALANANEQLKLEIAERQQITNALRVANEEWANTFNASTDPIMILDCNCRIRRANSSMAALLGKQVEECVGKFCYEQFHHTETPILLCPHNQMLHDGRPHTEEIFEENIGKHLLVTVSPFFDAKGSLVGSMHYAKDITLLKEAEQVLADVNISLEHKVSERTSELVQANEQIKKVSFELVWAEEKERERIASELHDQVGQSLLLAKMKLDALAEKLSDNSLHTYAAAASSLVETSIHDIRSLTFRMRPPILDTAGIETALKWLCSSISYDYKINVEFADDDKPKQLSIELRYSLYQAVRELLLNVVKHADTEKASLSICTDNHTLVVHVTDKGVGFNPPDAIIKHVNKGGYGLYNVKQRVERMGGRFEVESAPGRGTSVTLSVPLDER